MNTGANVQTNVLTAQNNNSIQNIETETKTPQNALNRTQINLLTDILTNVANGVYPFETAKAIIGASFPILANEQIEQILNPFRQNANN